MNKQRMFNQIRTTSQRGNKPFQNKQVVSMTDELLKDIYKSINTDYDKEKEEYKQQRKLTTV